MLRCLHHCEEIFLLGWDYNECDSFCFTFCFTDMLSLHLSSRGKANYINLGSFLIKPVQRVMRYPLLLTELLGATPESHHDRPQLTQAVQAAKEINININEHKRRKDLGKNRKTCCFSLKMCLSNISCIIKFESNLILDRLYL